jgi:hypothetical protein
MLIAVQTSLQLSVCTILHASGDNYEVEALASSYESGSEELYSIIHCFEKLKCVQRYNG